MAASVERVVAGWRRGEADVAQLATERTLSVAMKSLYGIDPGSDAATIGRLSKLAVDA